MDAQDYTYHADDSDLAVWSRAFTSRNGDGGGDHEENFYAALALVAACKAGGAFLDVGSGVGRIIDRIRPNARTVTGLEPDKQRFLACETGFSADQRIEMFNTTSWDYRASHPGRRFDFITVSMVLQHVSTSACQRILGDVRELLAPGGVAMISTTHFFEERFSYESDPSPHDRAEFDRYADQSGAHDRGIPVRMFSKQALYREVERAGLEVIVWQQFSYLRPEKVGEVAGMYGASEEETRDFGISQYAVVRRAGRAAPGRGWLASLRYRLSLR